MAVFITLEGGDGSGKSTLLGRIQDHLERKRARFITTREPGGTPVAEEIRELLLRSRAASPSPMTELLLFEAARAEHVEKVIRPALAAGKHVLCDRFTDSTLAFQGYARGLGVKLVSDLNRTATSGLEPDAVIWLRLEPKQARARVASRGEINRIDAEKDSFHQAVFDAFETMSKEIPARFIVLDASRSPDEVFQQLLTHPRWLKLFGDEA